MHMAQYQKLYAIILYLISFLHYKILEKAKQLWIRIKVILPGKGKSLAAITLFERILCDPQT